MKIRKSLLEHVQVENRERYDYRQFLRKFSVWKEEMQVDPDSFDYVFSNYDVGAGGKDAVSLSADSLRAITYFSHMEEG